jgi:uncharacterized protein YecE (DUF72 family)
MSNTELRIGISGWTYAPWRGVFYPKGLVQKRELEYASRQMNSIEINGTFYSLQRPESFEKWAAATPDDFLFSVKGPKYITHMKKLADVRQPLANFFASGPLKLGKKFGPILWQFPPWLGYGRERFETFIDLLPRTSAEASALAGEHNLKKKKWIWTEAVAETDLQYAFEVRNPSFLDEDFIKLIRKKNIALVFADSAGKWPYAEDVTGDIIYIRLHGAKEIYVSGYTDEDLERWAGRIEKWQAGTEPTDAKKVVEAAPRKKKRSVYVYFDNDIKVKAPFDAMRLAEMLEKK